MQNQFAPSLGKTETPPPFAALGDRHALADWLQQHSPALRHEARRLLRGRADAEDLVQDVWLRLLNSPERLDDLRQGDSGRALSYLRTMLRNRFIDERVRRHHVSRMDRDADIEAICDAEERGPEERAAAAEAQAMVRAALAQLPLAQQQVLTLWSESVSIREMCSRTGAPFDTVLNRRKYGLARLRKALLPTVRPLPQPCLTR